MYLHREYFKAKVYTSWEHGPLGMDDMVHGMASGFRIKGQEVKDLGFLCRLHLANY